MNDTDLSKSTLIIIQHFFNRIISKRKYQKRLSMQKSAIKIQRLFRCYLMKQEFHNYYLNKCAQKIQRIYRKFLYDMKQNDARRNYFNFRLNQIRLQKSQQTLPLPKITDNSTKRNKPKQIIELPPPWGQKNKKSFSQAQLDDLISNQISDMKWIKTNITSKFITKIFTDIKNRQTIRDKCLEFQQRLVPRTFYTLSLRSSELYNYGSILQMYFHESTFRIINVHRNGISIQKVNPNNSDEIRFYPSVLPILDSAFDKNSGRLVLINQNWYISSFENDFFTKPQKLRSVPMPVLPQKKYITMDKFGHIFLVLTQKYHSVYLLDSICYSLLKKFSDFTISPKSFISAVHPIYLKMKPVGFYATSNTTSEFCIFDDEKNKLATFSDHIKFPPSFYVNSSFVFTFGKDKKVNIYQRKILNRVPQLLLLKTLELESIPLCISYIKAMHLLVVGLSNSQIKIFTFVNENQLLTFPYSSLSPELQKYAEDTIGEPKTTSFYGQYSCILTKRLQYPPSQILVTQFAHNCVFIIVKLNDNQIDTFWLFQKSRKIKCIDFDLMAIQPITMNPHFLASKIAESQFETITESIEKTRNQLDRDSLYFRTVGKEFEKRFLSSKFMRKSSENAVTVLFQSPYRRWVRWLGFCFNQNRINQDSKRAPRNYRYRKPKQEVQSNSFETLSIYEVYSLVNKFDIFVPSLNTVEKFNHFFVEVLPEIAASPVGPFSTTFGTTLAKDEMVIGFDVVNAIPGSQFSHYQVLKTAVLSVELTIPSIQLKTSIRNFNEYAILRLTEIENLIKNKQRSTLLKHSIEELLGKTKSSPKKIKFSDSWNFKNETFSYYDDEEEEINDKSIINRIPKIFPEMSAPLLNKKLLKKSSIVMPNPLFEAFRYHHPREGSIDYFAYGIENPSAQLINLKQPLENVDEIRLARSLANFGMAVDMIAISNTNDQILTEYPSNFFPLSYLLTYNQFRTGHSSSIKAGLFWLSRILIILCAMHRSNFVLRMVLPDNIIISNDGNEVKILSLSEFTQYSRNSDRKSFKKVSYDNQFSPWLPPEYWAQMIATPAFDMYQFGILMVVVLTGFIPASFGNIVSKHMKYRKNEDPMDIARSQSFFFDPLEGFPYDECSFFTVKNHELEASLQIKSRSSLFDIAVSCLDINPSRRPTAKQLLELPFFSFTPYDLRNARNVGFSLIRKVPLPIFTDSIFKNLFLIIEQERNQNPRNIPILETVIDIINFFINRNASGIRIAFPIDEQSVKEIEKEIFRQNVFDKIVDYVIGQLQVNFEFDSEIHADRTFTKLYNLFNISKYNTEISKSFYHFCTGVRGNIDSYKLFCFLHSKMRKMVKFFFQNTTLEIQKVLGISEFYSHHFLQFYDNSRDFAEAFNERSERRHAASLQYFTAFIENYPTKETMHLLIDFKIHHKIEQAWCFTESKVRIAALDLLMKIFDLESNFDETFLNGFLFHAFAFYLTNDESTYDERMAMICVIRDVLFSKSMSAIVSLLISGILNIIVECAFPKADRLDFSKACKDLLCEICDRGITSVISIIYTDEYLLFNCIKLGVIRQLNRKEFDVMINHMKIHNFVDDSLLSTLMIAESASFAAISAVTELTQQSFENSLDEICTFLINQKETLFEYNSLFRSFLLIHQNHNLKLNKQLVKAIAEGMQNDFNGYFDMAIELLQIIQLPKLPSVFSEFISVWFDRIQKDIETIKQICIEKVADSSILQNYKDERDKRLRFFRSVLLHIDHGLNVEFVTLCNFPALIINSFLADSSKFEIKVNVVPASFAKYNHTFPLRSEGMDYIREISKYKANCHLLFHVLATSLKDSHILEKEAIMLRKVKDYDFRRTSIRLLRLLNDKNDSYNLNKDILQSEALKLLKEIALYDWENVEIRRGVMNLENMKQNTEVLSDIRMLYDSFIW